MTLSSLSAPSPGCHPAALCLLLSARAKAEPNSGLHAFLFLLGFCEDLSVIHKCVDVCSLSDSCFPLLSVLCNCITFSGGKLMLWFYLFVCLFLLNNHLRFTQERHFPESSFLIKCPVKVELMIY